MDFTLKRPDKVKRLKKILDALKLKYTLKPRKGKENTYRFLLPSQKLTQELSELLGPKKHFGPWLLDLPRPLLDLFCEEIWLWDATKEKATGYASEEKTNADWVQTVLALSGRRAQVREYQPAKGKPSWQVDHVEDEDSSHTTNVKRGTTKSEDGNVYCATVPSGFILVRRNGKICVTGNCPRDADFRSLFIARAGHLLMTCDYNAVELRTLSAICKTRFGFSKLADVINQGLDPHTYTTGMLLGEPYEKVAAEIKKEKAS